jgi:hypothetical protein
MPITPRFQIGKQRRSGFPDKEFTNRDTQRRAFLSLVDGLANNLENKDECRVVVYYGVGGVGKSSLLKQLTHDLLKVRDNAAFSSVDFIDPSCRTVAKALLELQRNIVCNKKISWPHFELAYSLYFKKKNPDIVFREKDLPFTEESSFMGNLLAALDHMGIAGAIVGGVSIAYKLFTKYGLEKELKADLTALEDLTAVEIEERLPAFFSYDLGRALKQNEIPVFVAFIDSYESLWENGKTESNIFSQDSWVRELIAHLPKVLFLISGRDRLRWSDVEAEWEKCIIQCLIENLSQKDANIFLTKCGIDNTELKEKIIKVSDGHPYHLNLSVDTYYELKSQGLEISLEKFASSRRNVLSRFLKNLDSSEIETLKVLSVPRYFDKIIFELLILEFKTGYPVTRFDDFNRFSFVKNNNGRYLIHALMRESLKQILGQDLSNAVHKTLAEFYSQQFKQITPVATNDALLALFQEENYHRSQCLSKIEYHDWLLKDKYDFIKTLQFRGEAKFLDSFLSDVVDYLGIEVLDVSILSIYIDVLHLGGNYKKAVIMASDFLSHYNKCQILLSNQLLHLYTRRIHYQMFYCPVQPLITDLIDMLNEINKGQFPERYNELLFMVGGNLGVLSGDFKTSRKVLVQSIKFASEHNFSDYVNRLAKLTHHRRPKLTHPSECF